MTPNKHNPIPINFIREAVSFIKIIEIPTVKTIASTLETGYALLKSSFDKTNAYNANPMP